MSLPVGHALFGYAAAGLVPVELDARWWRTFLLAGAAALLPDLDLLPGVLMGDPGRFHHGPTHTLFAAGLVGLSCGMWAWWRRRTFWGPALLIGVAYASHVVLDMATPRRSVGGADIALLWPLTDRGFQIPVPVPDWLYQGLGYGSRAGSGGMFEGVLSEVTLRALAFELLLFLPLALLALGVRRRWARRAAKSGGKGGDDGTRAGAGPS